MEPKAIEKGVGAHVRGCDFRFHLNPFRICGSKQRKPDFPGTVVACRRSPAASANAECPYEQTTALEWLLVAPVLSFWRCTTGILIRPFWNR